MEAKLKKVIANTLRQLARFLARFASKEEKKVVAEKLAPSLAKKAGYVPPYQGWFKHRKKKMKIAKESRRRNRQYLALVLLFVPTIVFAEMPYPVDTIVDAIYWSEGGTKAHTPFGIETVSCQGYEECRQVCRRTVKNQHRRWRDSQANLGQSYKLTYMESLARRYCPPNWKVWLKNVEYFCQNPKPVPQP